MKLEYNYTIGADGIAFSFIDDHDDGICFEGSREDRMTIQKYIMLAWQDAINQVAEGPDEIRLLMSSEEGRARLKERAEVYLAKLLDTIPPELDRRHDADRRNVTTRPRETKSDRRRLRRSPNHQ
jgi:hypothetical protein